VVGVPLTLPPRPLMRPPRLPRPDTSPSTSAASSGSEATSSPLLSQVIPDLGGRAPAPAASAATQLSLQPGPSSTSSFPSVQDFAILKGGPHDARLKVLFVCNTTTFVASLLILVMLLEKKLCFSQKVRSYEIYGFIAVTLISLLSMHMMQVSCTALLSEQGNRMNSVVNNLRLHIIAATKNFTNLIKAHSVPHQAHIHPNN
jgi:hypothetical protein